VKKAALALVVVLAGAAGGYFGRPFAEPYVGGPRELEAEVAAERAEESRLVLTLRAGDETMLATFHRRAGDVAELVEPGDTIVLRTRGEGVFADDAEVLRVSRPFAHHDAEGTAEPETEEVAAAPDASVDTEADTPEGDVDHGEPVDEAVAVEAASLPAEEGHPPS
jgi:hypothetical protein